MAIAADLGKSIFRRTEKQLLRLASERHAEAVHGYRTTVRRLQTLLEQLVTGDGGQNKKLLKRLNRIRRAAGKVRDLDVQLEALRSLKVPQEPRRKTQLMQHLIDTRARHERKLRKLLGKDDIREMQRRLRRAERALRYESGRDPLGVAKEILGSVALPGGHADKEVLHRYRVAVKKARYAVEFAPSSAQAATFLTGLKRLQDALGNWHDWLTLSDTAAEQLGNVNESPLVAALHNVTQGKFRNAVAAISNHTNRSARIREIRPLPKSAASKTATEPDRTAAA